MAFDAEAFATAGLTPNIRNTGGEVGAALAKAVRTRLVPQDTRTDQ
jgi:hypothetical protein